MKIKQLFLQHTPSASLVLAALAMGLLLIKAVVIAQITGDLMYLVIWVGGVILFAIGLWPVRRHLWGAR